MAAYAIPLPYYLGWLLIAAVFFCLSILALAAMDESFDFIGAFLILSIIIALEGTAIIWAHNKMRSFDEILSRIVDLPRDEVTRICRDQESRTFNDKRALMFAISFITFVHLSGIDYHAISFNSGLCEFIFNAGYYFAVYIESVGFYIMIMTALAVHKVGLLPLQINTLYSDFHAVGMLYSKFTIYAACVYIVWGIFHMIVPPLFSSLQVILWFSVFAVLLLAYFVLPQYNIHYMMISTKKEKLDLFSSLIKVALEESTGAAAGQNASRIKDMISVQNQLDQMCEWPFGTHELLQIALIIIIPLVIVILEVALGLIR